MNQNPESGTISIQFLSVLFLITAIAGGSLLMLSTGMKAERRAAEKKIRYESALTIIESVMEDLLADPSPDINSADDPVWKRDKTVVSDFEISVKPLSDAINPNFVRKNVFEKTSLSKLFKDGKNADQLQQFREDNGLALDENFYLDFFEKERYPLYFSSYGWANVNIVDEFAARSLTRSVTGSESEAESVFNAIQKLLLSGTLATRTTLGSVLGFSDNRVFPYLNAEPPMNINFVSPLILRELAAYPEYKVSHPDEKCETILSLRTNGGILAPDIAALFGIEKNNRLTCYFGSITWFYEIRLHDKTGTYIAVICRLPPHNNEPQITPVYQLIEMRHTI